MSCLKARQNMKRGQKWPLGSPSVNHQKQRFSHCTLRPCLFHYRFTAAKSMVGLRYIQKSSLKAQLEPFPTHRCSRVRLPRCHISDKIPSGYWGKLSIKNPFLHCFDTLPGRVDVFFSVLVMVIATFFRTSSHRMVVPRLQTLLFEHSWTYRDRVINFNALGITWHESLWAFFGSCVLAILIVVRLILGFNRREEKGYWNLTSPVFFEPPIF